MVSKSFKKVAIIIAIVVVLGIALVPVFAGGHNERGRGHNNGNYNGGGCGYNGNNSSSRHGMGNYQVGGTLQLIDADAGTISVENANGYLTVVSITPTTSIIDMTDLDTTMGSGRGHMGNMGNMMSNRGNMSHMGNMGNNDYFADIDTTNMTDAEIRLAYFEARETAIEEWEAEMASRTIALNDLEVGDWVEVSSASNRTNTREANVVSVYR